MCERKTKHTSKVYHCWFGGLHKILKLKEKLKKIQIGTVGAHVRKILSFNFVNIFSIFVNYSVFPFSEWNFRFRRLSANWHKYLFQWQKCFVKKKLFVEQNAYKQKKL